jgi:DNA invertase Pin-like site-specific DNA recombinase
MKIGYARVSTREQSLQLQVDALKSTGCEKIYQEVASGSKTARLVLDDLMNNIRAGDTLVIWKLDRLGRNLAHLLHMTDELIKKEVCLISLNDPIDTTTSHGRLIFSIFASLAEFERALIAERTIAGLKAARARGRLGGRPSGLSQGAAEKAEIAETLYKAGGISINTITKQLNISAPTLYAYLRHRGVEIGSSPIKKVVHCG